MKRRLLIAGMLVMAATVMAAVKGLQCEYMDNPIGIDKAHPRLSWTLPDSRAKVTVKIWDSNGKAEKVFQLVPGTQQLSLHDIILPEAHTFLWTVTIGRQTSDTARFTTNLSLGQAQWISDGHDAAYRPLARYRRTVSIRKPVREAWLTVASGGLHELTLNGQKIGNHRLDPMYTRFDRHILSVMHDVTDLLKTGDNVIGAELGNGWFNHQSTAVWSFHEASWRQRPCMAARLLIRYTDGTEETIVTDRTWQTTESATIFSSIYTAEHYDARRQYLENIWKPVVIVDCPTRKVTSQVMHPIRCTAVIKAEKMVRLSDSLVVYHFPKNMAGVTRLKIQGTAGTAVRIKHGEMLYEDGRVNLGNIDYHYRPTDDSDPFQTDILILSGGQDEFAARFGYKGFQYVEVSAPVPLQLTKESLVAEEMHSDVPVISQWQSSSDYLNRLLKATNNSYLCNLFGYPTDCPQREKNGWTADAWLALETGLATYDVVTIFEKWMGDMRDEQKQDGRLPCIVPTDKWGYDWANGVDWTSATIIIPWQLYLYKGDTALLQEHYDSMKKFVGYIESIAKNHLTDWGLGDWIPVKTTSNLTYTTSVYYYVDAVIMEKVAAVLGKEEDRKHYQQLAADIREAIDKKFLNRKKAIYAKGTQTELSMALYWNVVPEELRAKMAYNLNEKVKANGYHLDVGVHGCKAILGALTDNGYAETAYRLVTQTSYPSWGHWIVQGATTLHENWKTDVIIDNSLNHIMFGEVGAWLHKGLAGITVDEELPAYRKVHVKPYFPQGLDSLSVSRETDFGTLKTAWNRKGNTIVYHIEVPSAMEVELTLPNNRKKVIKGGQKTYSFQL